MTIIHHNQLWNHLVIKEEKVSVDISLLTIHIQNIDSFDIITSYPPPPDFYLCDPLETRVTFFQDLKCLLQICSDGNLMTDDSLNWNQKVKEIRIWTSIVMMLIRNMMIIFQTTERRIHLSSWTGDARVLSLSSLIIWSLLIWFLSKQEM